MTEQNGPQWPLPEEPASAEEPQPIDPPTRPAGERTVIFGAPQLGQKPPTPPAPQQPPASEPPPAPPKPVFDANATMLDPGRHAAPQQPQPQNPPYGQQTPSYGQQEPSSPPYGQQG